MDGLFACVLGHCQLSTLLYKATYPFSLLLLSLILGSTPPSTSVILLTTMLANGALIRLPFHPTTSRFAFAPFVSALALGSLLIFWLDSRVIEASFVVGQDLSGRLMVVCRGLQMPRLLTRMAVVKHFVGGNWAPRIARWQQSGP